MKAKIKAAVESISYSRESTLYV